MTSAVPVEKCQRQQSSADSRAALAARHVLPVRIEVPSNWDSAAAALMLVEALIAAVSQRNWDQFETRVRELEQLRAQWPEEE